MSSVEQQCNILYIW